MLKVLLLAAAMMIPAASEVKISCEDARNIKIAALAQATYQTRLIVDKSDSIAIDEFVVRRAVVNAMTNLLKDIERFENTHCPAA